MTHLGYDLGGSADCFDRVSEMMRPYGNWVGPIEEVAEHWVQQDAQPQGVALLREKRISPSNISRLGGLGV